jgi:hypothetical protein
MSAIDPTVEVAEVSTGDVEWNVEDVAAAGEAAGAEAETREVAEPREEVLRGMQNGGAHENGGAPQALQLKTGATPADTARKVSGRYRNFGKTEVELRVDVDGRRPTRRVSGDVYSRMGSTLFFTGSFVVHAPTMQVTPTHVRIDGTGSFSWAAGSTRVRVTLPRTTPFQPMPAATLEFLSGAGAVTARHVCPFQSTYFRTVQLEQDQVAGMTPFNEYDTGSLPAPPPKRKLTIPSAYAEAGVEVQVGGVSNVVPTAGIGPSWSNAELHNAMVTHFSLWRDTPQWKVWLLTADLHELGPSLHGIMFDQQGRQRQGCAVFHRDLGGTTPDKQRRQLYTCVHELGHCFNLYHSFHKQYMTPPQPNRLGALSWMNYPRNYQPTSGPAGEPAFWSAFPFEFDMPELVHLRHGFRNDVIFGANPFGTGAALEDGELFAPALEDASGLHLELRGRTSFRLGEPVVTELKLSTTDLRGREVNAELHPNFGFMQVAIRHPSGRVQVYRPYLEHCLEPRMAVLDAAQPAVYTSAYLGFGRDGLYFDSPGLYQLRAVYLAADGSRVVSNTFSVRVRSPLTDADDALADAYLGDEQGALFYLRGSDSDHLRNGNAAFDEVVERFPDHPLTAYAQMVRGYGLSREFKEIRDDRVVARAARPVESAKALSWAVAASCREPVLDFITLSDTWLRLAHTQVDEGDADVARRTAQEMVDWFAPRVNPRVLGRLQDQASLVGEEPAG